MGDNALAQNDLGMKGKMDRSTRGVVQTERTRGLLWTVGLWLAGVLAVGLLAAAVKLVLGDFG